MSFEPTFTRLRDCRYGRMLYNANDVYVGRSFDEYGEYCEFEIELLRQVIREGDVVSRDLVRYIDSLGYDLFWHRPPLFNPNNFRGNANNVFGTVITANMICVPRAWGATMQHFEKVPVPE
jgi:hypothetical protein